VAGWLTVSDRDGDRDYCSRTCAKLAALTARVPA
jgi:hypothetical protein